MLFVIKRLIGQLIAPLPLVTLTFLLGWLIAFFARYRLLGRLLQLFAAILFLAFSVGGFEHFLYRLEQVYPPFEPTPEQCGQLSGAEIVVLGQGLEPDSNLPVRFRDNDAFRNRMLEAARIARRVPGSRLLVSMAGTAAPADKQAALAEYASLFSIEPERMVMIGDGIDTESEARLALAAAQSSNVIVVTSASHLPRAMPLFDRAAHTHTNAFRFIAAPADFQARKQYPTYSWSRLPLPDSDYCKHTDRLFHETCGGIFEKLRRALSTSCYPPPASSGQH
jgi:uncharacterized SAM-binding protein YcdF (DUF218 family)